jgi:ABC-type antimicrobial peptide transport system permease subunit
VNAAPVLKAAAGGARRRLLQSVLVLLVVGAATAAGTLALTLATSANALQERALARYRVPNLAVMIDASKVTGAQLGRTRDLKGVTRAAGPYPATTITLAASSGGAASPPLTVVGRASSSGPLDDLICFTSPPGISSCGWPIRPGELELSSFAQVQIAPGGGRLGPVGTRVTVTSVRRKPTLTVVGYAVSVSETADAWAVPAQIAALQMVGAPRLEQMLYTFAHAATTPEVDDDLAKLKATLPAGAIISSSSPQPIVHNVRPETAIDIGAIVALAIIALLVALLICANVVSAAVLASYRRIGALKSVGFTPAQLTLAYLAQIGAPALAGAGVGAVVGNRWALPVINRGPLHLSIHSAPLWIIISIPLGILALVAIAAAVPAIRAGGRSAVEVTTAGQAPRSGHGYAAHRRAGRLPLPRSVSIGLTTPLTRTARTAATFASVAFGLAALVFAVGLDKALSMNPAGRLVDYSLLHLLTAIIAVLAGLGALATTLMAARERLHDLGIFKALGTTPRQTLAMVTSWAILPGLAAAVIALPVGMALENTVLHATAQARPGGPPRTGPGPTGAIAGMVRSSQPTSPQSDQPPSSRSHAPTNPTGAPASQAAGRQTANPRRIVSGPDGALPAITTVYSPGGLVLLALAGLGIAALGALVPACWAAASRTTTALHAE